MKKHLIKIWDSLEAQIKAMLFKAITSLIRAKRLTNGMAGGHKTILRLLSEGKTDNALNTLEKHIMSGCTLLLEML